MSKPDNVLPFTPGQSIGNDNVIVKDDIIDSNDNYDGGGGNMDSFVRKHELERVKSDLSHQIETNYIKTEASINDLKKDINNLKDALPKTVKLALLENNEKLEKEAKETRRFIIGTVIIGGLGLAASIISIVISLL